MIEYDHDRIRKGGGQNNKERCRCKSITVPFARAFKASEDVRHLNVVVVSCVNELSLLRGLLGRFFLAALFRGLLLSCHIVVSPS